MSPPLARSAVRAVLLRRTIDTYRDSPQAAGWLQHNLARLDEPLRVAIAGKVKAGKSTLLNALVGEEIAPDRRGRVHPGRHLVPRRRHAPQVTMFPRDGGRRGTLPIHRRRRGAALDLRRRPGRAGRPAGGAVAVAEPAHARR